jgi:anaphase-promoting complex subunit 2
MAVATLHKGMTVLLHEVQLFSAALDGATGAEIEARSLSTMRVLCFGGETAQPFDIQRLLLRYLQAAFASYRGGLGEEAAWLEGEEDEEDEPKPQEELIALEKAVAVFDQLRGLGCSSLLEEPLRLMILSYLEEHIPRDEGRFAGEFEEPLLAQLSKWVKEVAVGFLGEVLGPESKPEQWGYHLDHQAKAIFAKLRIAELFNITRNFPESIPALRDLQSSVQQTDMNDHLCSAMRAQLSHRLLQAHVHI